jgi:hypothetical protein
MTNEEKQAFYAQYWGQNVAKYRQVKLNYLINDVNISVTGFLELRTIEMLTDDEINVMQGRSVEHKISTDLRSFVINDSFRLTVNADYLRSIGVLVGFRNFTPEMLIAEGVVKIKDV